MERRYLRVDGDIEEERKRHLTGGDEPFRHQGGIGKSAPAKGGPGEKERSGAGGGGRRCQGGGPENRLDEAQVASGACDGEGIGGDAPQDAGAHLARRHHLRERLERLEHVAVSVHTPPARAAGGEVSGHTARSRGGEILVREIREQVMDTRAGFHHESSLFRRNSRARKRRFFTVPKGSCFTRAMSSYDIP